MGYVGISCGKFVAGVMNVMRIISFSPAVHAGQNFAANST
jgi:hypothetical protein